MGSRLRKKSAIKPYKKNTVSPQDDLAGKFAKMQLTPSQRKVLQVVSNSKKGKRASAKPYKGLGDKFAKMRLTPSSQSGSQIPLRLPLLIHQLVKEALVYVDRLKENKDDYWAKEDLRATIHYIDDMAAPFHKSQGHLPTDWKFDPDACRALVS